MVPADSQQIPRARCYSRTPPHNIHTVFAYGTLTHSGPPSQVIPLTMQHHAQTVRSEKAGLTTPNTQPLTGITCARFSLLRFRSPLLTESLVFSLPTGTEMFHFPAFPPNCLYIQQRVTVHHDGRVSPFGHPRITAWLTAPRGLSQPPTSFIGS